MRIVDTNDPDEMAEVRREGQMREIAWEKWGKQWNWDQDGKTDFYRSVAMFRFYHCNPASELVFLREHPALVSYLSRVIEITKACNTLPWYEGWYLNLNPDATKLNFYFVTDQHEQTSQEDFAEFAFRLGQVPAVADVAYLAFVRENYVPRPAPSWLRKLVDGDEE